MVHGPLTRPDAGETTASDPAVIACKPDGYFRNAREEMLSLVPAGVRTILEVGCGEGHFGRRLTGPDREVWGVERDTPHALMAGEQLDRVLVGSIETLIGELPPSYFDLVVFNDVLEHLVEPADVLAEIRAVLTDGGMVMSSIPNIRYLPILSRLVIRGQWTYEDSGVLDRTHLRFFTSSSIVRMYHDAGYEVVRHEGINPMQVATVRHRVASLFLRGPLADMRFLQFATLARPATTRG